MMAPLTLTNARLIDPEAGTETLGALTIADGVVRDVFADPNPAVENSLDCEGHCVAPGIVDIGVKIGEPGERHKESFRTAGAAAAAGGVTRSPSEKATAPASRRKPISTISFPSRPLVRAAKGAIWTGELSAARRVTTNTKVLIRALSYARSCGALTIA
ncbi:MAG: dihydroorotase, partial [Pseudomonadota bacterium]